MKCYFVIVQRWSHAEKIMYTMCTYMKYTNKALVTFINYLRVSDNFKLKTELIISPELNFVEIQFKLTLQTSTFCTEIQDPKLQ